MREILFRGKRTDNGEWVEGGLLQTENWSSICVYEHYQGSLNEPPYSDVEEFDVIPETVGEFTGLLDKNGKKIFEGDIVIWRFSPCIVKWDAINACYSLYQNGKTKVSGFNADTMKLFEVIGNIHDNPELITQED